MLALPLTAVGQSQTDAERFVGDYTLISYVAFPEAGAAVDMAYVGRLSYDSAGNMSWALVRICGEFADSMCHLQWLA